MNEIENLREEKNKALAENLEQVRTIRNLNDSLDLIKSVNIELEKARAKSTKTNSRNDKEANYAQIVENETIIEETTTAKETTSEKSKKAEKIVEEMDDEEDDVENKRQKKKDKETHRSNNKKKQGKEGESQTDKDEPEKDSERDGKQDRENERMRDEEIKRLSQISDERNRKVDNADKRKEHRPPGGRIQNRGRKDQSPFRKKKEKAESKNETVCRFFLEGRCDFGSDCWNSHKTERSDEKQNRKGENLEYKGGRERKGPEKGRRDRKDDDNATDRNRKADKDQRSKQDHYTQDNRYRQDEHREPQRTDEKKQKIKEMGEQISFLEEDKKEMGAKIYFLEENIKKIKRYMNSRI